MHLETSQRLESVRALFRGQHWYQNAPPNVRQENSFLADIPLMELIIEQLSAADAICLDEKKEMVIGRCRFVSLRYTDATSASKPLTLGLRDGRWEVVSDAPPEHICVFTWIDQDLECANPITA